MKNSKQGLEHMQEYVVAKTQCLRPLGHPTSLNEKGKKKIYQNRNV